MTDQKIIKTALGEGFLNAEIIDTDQIVFDSAFRPYCEENLCGQYGANYSCPPDCGTPEQMKQKVLSHKKALVLQTEWEIADFSQKDKLRVAKSEHNAAMFRVIKRLRENGHGGFMIGASGCTLCNPCAMPKGEPCKHPDLQYSCMAAYCIYVKRLAESCSMNYDYRNGILPFFGMYVFD
ncbi:MAG: DUF2284 domain-containing protein [Clostridia bacterium]|nr:DUF2284 domain-containing protein [Clostridia bacterium]